MLARPMALTARPAQKLAIRATPTTPQRYHSQDHTLGPRESERRILLADRGPKRDSGSRTTTPAVQLESFNERRRLGWEISWDGKCVQLHPGRKIAELALVDPQLAETQRAERTGQAADAAASERLMLEKQDIMNLIAGGHWEEFSGKASWIPSGSHPMPYLRVLSLQLCVAAK